MGDKLTIADLLAFTMWNRKLDGVPHDYFDQFPHIKAHKKLIASHPKIAAHYAPKVRATMLCAVSSVPLTCSQGFPKLKLTYFDAPGITEPIRLTFFVCVAMRNSLKESYCLLGWRCAILRRATESGAISAR